MQENNQSQPIVTLTESAIKRLLELLAEVNTPNLKFRVSVQGGGCAGFSYNFVFDEIMNDDDIFDIHSGVPVIIDSMSMQYIIGSTLDFVEGQFGSQFIMSNPGADTTCGCGSSFSHNGDFEDFGHGY